MKCEKDKQLVKEESEMNHDSIPVKVKKQQTNIDSGRSSLPEKLLLKSLSKMKAPDKTVLKPLPRLAPMQYAKKIGVNDKTNRLKTCEESMRQISSMLSRPRSKSDNTNTPPVNAKPVKDTYKFQRSKPVCQASKASLLQPSKTGKVSKVPVLLKSNSQNDVKKIPKLQPLLRAKSLGEGSDSGVSDSSDRILAWLADTARIDFKNHPVPNIAVEQYDPSQAKLQRNTGKKKSEKQKTNIIERVEMNSETTKSKSDILDKLLPKLPETHPKQRFASYDLTLTGLKHSKACNPSEFQQETGLTLPTSAKTTAFSSIKVSTADQNDLSSKFANCVPRNVGEKITDSQNGVSFSENVRDNEVNNCTVVTSVAGVRNVDYSQREKSLVNGAQLTQPFISSAPIQRQSEVLADVEQIDEVFSMEEGMGSDVSIQLSESDVADMEIDNAEELAKEIVQEVYIFICNI